MQGHESGKPRHEDNVEYMRGFKRTEIESASRKADKMDVVEAKAI